jgi:hypothetical protein
LDEREKGFTSVFTPRAPAFFTGAACVLLTNAGPFSARVTVQTEGLDERERNFSGQLLGRGSKLLFAPDPAESSRKQQRAGGFGFLWDIAENRGYVLSDALQAYAPISSNLQVTNLVFSPVQAAPEKFGGHLCEAALATVAKADGTAVSFEVLKAADLNGFPVRIHSHSNSPPLTLTFSKIRLETPGADVFVPPEGFSKYSSPEALVDELAARQHNLRRRPQNSPQPFTGYGGGH